MNLVIISKKVILMNIGIYMYITGNIIISSARAIVGRPCRLFLTAREVSCCHDLCYKHFSSLLLATSGDMWQITSVIALSLDIHVF